MRNYCSSIARTFGLWCSGNKVRVINKIFGTFSKSEDGGARECSKNHKNMIMIIVWEGKIPVL